MSTACSDSSSVNILKQLCSVYFITSSGDVLSISCRLKASKSMQTKTYFMYSFGCDGSPCDRRKTGHKNVTYTISWPRRADHTHVRSHHVSACRNATGAFSEGEGAETKKLLFVRAAPTRDVCEVVTFSREGF